MREFIMGELERKRLDILLKTPSIAFLPSSDLLSFLVLGVHSSQFTVHSEILEGDIESEKRDLPAEEVPSRNESHQRAICHQQALISLWQAHR